MKIENNKLNTSDQLISAKNQNKSEKEIVFPKIEDLIEENNIKIGGKVVKIFS